MAAFLKELKLKYGGPDYESVSMSIYDHEIGKVHNQVKAPWFLEINPNGRIPAITHNGFSVFESSAILLYLSAQFDKEHAFSRDPITDPQGYSEQLQWLFFTHGGIGPMSGQAIYFVQYAPEKTPYAIERYVNEVKRLYGVLEKRLVGREYLVDTYNIADLKTWGWVRKVRDFPSLGISLDEFPNLNAWVERIEARPGIQSSLHIS